MDQSIRNKLRNVVTQCRKLLEEAVAQVLQGQFGIYATGKKDEVNVDDDAKMKHLSDEDRAYRKDLLDHLEHVKALGYKPTDSLAQLVREIAFTHLNRFCAYKMMEARNLIRESVSKGLKSQGFLFYLADHEDDEKRANSGQQDVAYRHFLNWLGGTLSEEIGVLFNPHDSANRLYPPQRVLEEILDLLNDETLADIWTQDETIGWVYQYFTPKELRDQVRKESQAPRNSYELAFRNQFFTPRYVVEFLTDNTLGRIWYEMRRGNTKLKDQCRYMVRRSKEIFLGNPLEAAKCLGITAETLDDLPPSVRAAFQGDFTVALAEKTAGYQQWIGLTIPHDQFETVTGHDGESHLDRVWDALDNHPDDPILADPSQILVALKRFSSTCSGGPYAVKPFQRLWEAFHAAVAANAKREDLTQEELLKRPVYIPFRPKKDPRELRILDPACGSGHFLLYCFDLLLTIYEEAYLDPDLGPKLQEEYQTLDALRRDAPRLILANNLHGIDIDLRASQIAALALWLRCQRAYQEMGIKKNRPKITRSNFVCAEPMPGEPAMLREFVDQLEPRLLGQLVEVVFDKMKLAGEAGSLLKIEEEIRTTLASAKTQWESGPVEVQLTLFDQTEPKLKHKPFNLAGVTDKEFFYEAEAKVVEALRTYAEKAANDQGLQRTLFTEDAVRGFAFVDVCHKRFDVVLMNPPFGNPSKNSKVYLSSKYPKLWADMYASFISRASDLLVQSGRLGAITSRTFFALPSFVKLRQLLLGEMQLLYAVECGLGVLDNATVRAAFTVAERGALQAADVLFIDLRRTETRDTALLDAVNWRNAKSVYHVAPAEFDAIPNKPFCYWLPRRFRSLLALGPHLDESRLIPNANSLSKVTVGASTTADERFVRCFWEVSPHLIGREGWARFAHAIGFCRFYAPTYTVMKWFTDGKEILSLIDANGNRKARLRCADHFFKKGMVSPYISELGLGCSFLPSEHILGNSCRGYYDTAGNSTALLSYMNSSIVDVLIWALTPDRKHEAGIIATIPVPDLTSEEATLKELAELSWRCVAKIRSQDETDPLFSGLHRHTNEFLAGVIVEATHLQTTIDASVARLFNLTTEGALELLTLAAAPHVYGKWDYTDKGESEDSEESECDDRDPEVHHDIKQPLQACRPKDWLSFGVGCAFGRWDITSMHNTEWETRFGDPHSPFPRVQPALLQTTDALPASQTPIDYPLRINWDGIIVDDSDNLDDVVRRVREVLELICGDGAMAIENDAIEIFQLKELRDYFRKAAKGGFWDDHVARYSKSRRSAPIYWLLQSAKKNYSIWIYYHRLDKDLFFKALVNYAEPKIRRESNRLDALRARKIAAGDTGNDAKKIDAEIEKQEDFISELQDFEDKLRRAADLHLDLNQAHFF